MTNHASNSAVISLCHQRAAAVIRGKVSFPQTCIGLIGSVHLMGANEPERRSMQKGRAGGGQSRERRQGAGAVISRPEVAARRSARIGPARQCRSHYRPASSYRPASAAATIGRPAAAAAEPNHRRPAARAGDRWPRWPSTAGRAGRPPPAGRTRMDTPLSQCYDPPPDAHTCLLCGRQIYYSLCVRS